MYAQTWQWAKEPSLTHQSYAAASGCGSNGSIYVAGTFGDTMVIQGQTVISGGNQDIYLAAFSSAGQLLWLKSFSGTGLELVYSLAVDSQDNLLLTGVITGPSVQFGNTTLPGHCSFLYKLSSSGQILWTKNFTGIQDCSVAITKMPADQVLLTGTLYDTLNIGAGQLVANGICDAFIMKYSPSGNLLWARSFGDTVREYGGSASCDSLGNIFLAGEFEGSSIVFGNNVTAAASTTLNAFLAAFDSSGTALWAKGLSTGRSGIQNGIVSCHAGKVFHGGTFGTQTLAVGSQTINMNSGSNIWGNYMNSFLAAYTTSGSFLWARSVTGNGNGMNGVSSDNNGNVVVAGYTHPFETGFGSQVYYSQSLGGPNLYVAKYDGSGNLLWSLVEGNNTDSNVPATITCDHSGSPVIAGWHMKPLTLGATTLNYASSMYGSLFVAKIGDNGSMTAIAEKKTSEFNVYPNPTAGKFIVSGITGKTQCRLFDGTGRQLQNFSSVGESYDMDLTSYDSGIYLLTLQNERSARNIKILKVR
jgi:hypothetical protein